MRTGAYEKRVTGKQPLINKYIKGNVAFRIKTLLETELSKKSVFIRFQKFESSLRDVSSLLENWDRSTGNVVRVETPKSETEPEITQTGSNKKMRDKKSDKEKEKEKILKEVNVLMRTVNESTFKTFLLPDYLQLLLVLVEILLHLYAYISLGWIWFG